MRIRISRFVPAGFHGRTEYAVVDHPADQPLPAGAVPVLPDTKLSDWTHYLDPKQIPVPLASAAPAPDAEPDPTPDQEA